MNQINSDLLNRIRAGLSKKAFVPMGPDGAQTAPPQDPNMAGPPMGAGMPPGGGGMPPGGMPPGGDMPPGADPSAAGIPGTGQPVMLQMSDLMQLMQMVSSGGGGAGGAAPAANGAAGGAAPAGGGKGGGAKELAAKVDSIAMDIAQIKAFIMGATGQDIGGGQGGAMPQMGAGVGSEMAPPTPMMPGQPEGMPPGMDQGGMPPGGMGGGMPPGAPPMPPGGGGMQVQASLQEKRSAAVPPMPKAKVLSGIINRLTR